jgi:hypothetical protein
LRRHWRNHVSAEARAAYMAGAGAAKDQLEEIVACPQRYRPRARRTNCHCPMRRSPSRLERTSTRSAGGRQHGLCSRRGWSSSAVGARCCRYGSKPWKRRRPACSNTICAINEQPALARLRRYAIGYRGRHDHDAGRSAADPCARRVAVRWKRPRFAWPPTRGGAWRESRPPRRPRSGRR